MMFLKSLPNWVKSPSKAIIFIEVRPKAMRRSRPAYIEKYTGREAPDMAVLQQTDVDEARRYTHETDEFAILTELQHYGGKNQPDRFYSRLPYSPFLRLRR